MCLVQAMSPDVSAAEGRPAFTDLPCAGPVGPWAPAFGCPRAATVGFMVGFGGPPRLDIALIACCATHQNVIGGWLHARFGECSFGDLAAAEKLPEIARREGRLLLIPTTGDLLTMRAAHQPPRG